VNELLDIKISSRFIFVNIIPSAALASPWPRSLVD
jgi:hypothetical protein